MRRFPWRLRLGWLGLVVLFLLTAGVIGACGDARGEGRATTSQVSAPGEGTVWVWDVPTPSPTPRSYMCDCILTQIPTPLWEAVGTPAP